MRGVCASVLAIMRIGQDRIAVDAFLAPRLAHELVQLARRQLLAPATEFVYILTPFTRRRPPGRPRRSWVLVLGRNPNPLGGVPEPPSRVGVSGGVQRDAPLALTVAARSGR